MPVGWAMSNLQNIYEEELRNQESRISMNSIRLLTKNLTVKEGMEYSDS
jgi:hypothetical protein